MTDMDRFRLILTGLGLSILFIMWIAVPASQCWRWTPVVAVVAAIPPTCLIVRKLRGSRRADRCVLRTIARYTTMDPFTVAIVLIIIGILFLIAEAFSPGAFMVIPGTVILIIGLIGAAFPDILFSLWSPVIAVAIAIPVTLATVYLYKSLAKPEPPATTVMESLVGKRGTVTVATEAGNMKGKVKIGSDTWSATSDSPIEAGAEVEVESSEGVHVHVRRV